MVRRGNPRTIAFATLFAVCAAAPSFGDAAKAKDLLGAFPTGSAQTPSAIGFYSRGCLAGGQELAETGLNWQAMRLSRNRNWGHPALIDYLQDLSAQVAEEVPGWAGLYIGDLAQPRGGPMISGHASHQIGLDADIWMLPPKRLNLTRRDREKISSISIRSADQRNVNQNWTDAHAQVLELAARDDRVDRIFVTAPAKIQLCKTAKRSDKKWLQKIRPYWGHHYHFHVRLKCPVGSRQCEEQSPTVQRLSSGGNGCDETLNWWVTTALEPPDPNAPKPKPIPGPKKKHPRQFEMSDLPKQCQGVLDSK
ncbi:MAG: penicillin-insensitive murein endopeptidase [Pseudomonadota bacterium]